MTNAGVDRVDAVVVGAGVVGLATARALALRGLETLVLEKAAAIGTATSSRNSEVLHAGLYYPSGSLKARLCVAGRERLHAYCAEHGVAVQRCGKLLVGRGAAQREHLEQIRLQAMRNGVDDLRWLSRDELRRLEPALAVDDALLSPSTGIVDSHALMLALQGDLEAAGGVVALRARLERVEGAEGGIDGRPLRLTVGGDAAMQLETALLVNAAGLWAPDLARRIEALPAALLPTARYAKGHYYALTGRAPFRHLIYPVPEAAGLGVHLTLDLAGQARFGPDVEWISPADADGIDYSVDLRRRAAFEAAIRSYWPGLPDGALQPAYSGVRPKLEGPDGQQLLDFIVQGPREHGVAGVVNLFGIESPGLTACLAIADAVVAALDV